MAKLTDSQLIILSAAAARDDGAAVVPVKMNKAAASKVGSSLVARKLMREVRARAGTPPWRQDGDGRPISLMITKAGRIAMGVEEPGGAERATASKSNAASRRSAQGVKEPANNKDGGKPDAVPAPRTGSKQALLIEMLSEKAGATLDALVAATGWLPHTTRAALTGLRKRGFSIERRREGETSVYHIVGQARAAA